jgi:hypothetical protein
MPIGNGYVIHAGNGRMVGPFVVDLHGNELCDGFYDMHMREHNLVIVNETIQ